MKRNGGPRAEDKTNVATDDHPDGGYGWFVVLGCHIVLFFCLAVNASAGPFFVAYREYFKVGAGETSWISSIVSFLTLSTGTFANVATKRFGCRAVVMFGGILSSTGYVISSFATSVHFLYFSIGILVGLSYGLMFSTSVSFVSQYFKRRHALANSLSFAGVAFGIITLPPLFQSLIEYYGWRGALIVLAGMNLNICVSAALFRPVKRKLTIKPKEDQLIPNGEIARTKDAKTERCPQCRSLFHILDWSLLWTNYRFSLTPYYMFMQGFCYYAIVVHLMPRAVFKGIRIEKSVYLVSVTGISSLLGRLAHGWFLHKVTFMTALQVCIIAMLICGLATVLSCLTWTYEPMLLYCAMLGLSSGTFLPVVPVAVREILGPRKLGAGFGLANVFMGIGSVLGPPVAGWFFDLTGNYDSPFYLSGALMMSAIFILFLDPFLKKKQDRRDQNANFELLEEREYREEIEYFISTV